ncbi:hypothetical protein TNCV_51731 [Trichonephila clavipes]|nr:hypothetical protein TNCV_51731 [Trichonephila clavipes]
MEKGVIETTIEYWVSSIGSLSSTDTPGGQKVRKNFGADVRKSKKQCIHNEQKTFTTLLHHMTTTTGEKTFQASDKSSNGRVQHVRMYGGYFSADRIFQFRQT